MNKEFKKRILSSLILIPLVLIIIIKGTFIFNLFLIFCLCIILYEWHMMSSKKNYYYFGIIFLIFSFYTIYKIYNFNDNYLNFLFILLICISTDIGGFVFGKLLKGPKLTSISPNKTYSGAIGGYILSIINVTLFFKFSFLFYDKIEILISTYVMTVIISSVSQIGDILVSYSKRLSNIKDTGKIIPGHGGLLDRADGMIFAFPFSYLTLSTNFNFF
tara:strand:+ start:80 stop:730 length:651 start_codon:yes stop_codon:yes gene_type:complete